MPDAGKPAKGADRQYGVGHKLVGKNYPTPDLYAKVTGAAKYAEDFRAEGMLFCKLLLSPMPHARVKHIDASKALAMPGVRAILTANDLPAPADTLTDNGTVIKASKWGERGLTMEPVYQGEPILAVAAVDEVTAADAIEKIKIDFEPLPFVVDPLETLRPGGPNPRTDGNVWTRPAPPNPPQPQVTTLKWADADFAGVKENRLPMGKAPDEWTYGDLDAGFKNAALVLDESFATPDTSHETLEPRSAMAYWQNGKLFMHTGTQSTAQTLPAIARWLNMDAEQYCFHQRIYRRRIRQQNHRRRHHDYSRAAGEEDQRARDDAHQPRRRNFHRSSAPCFSGSHESRLRQRRANHSSRHVRHLRQRSLRFGRRRILFRTHRFFAVSAASHALARSDGADQHAATQCPKLTRWPAGNRHHRAHHRESRAQTRTRSSRHPPHQLSGREGGIRAGGER